MPAPQDARHIANAAGDFAPQHQNSFLVEIAGLQGDDKDLIVLSLHSFAIPTEGNNIVEIPYGNTTIKVAGKALFEDAPLVVKDFVDRETRNALIRWRRQVSDSRTGNVGLPSAYKKTVDVLLEATDGSNIRICRLYGAWPSNLEGGELDMASDEQVLMTMTITIDRHEWLID